jgi:hypothetical protein
MPDLREHGDIEENHQEAAAQEAQAVRLPSRGFDACEDAGRSSRQ